MMVLHGEEKPYEKLNIILKKIDLEDFSLFFSLAVLRTNKYKKPPNNPIKLSNYISLET